MSERASQSAGERGARRRSATTGSARSAASRGVKPYVLRYWESEFRWMAPQKSRSKQRLYRQRDVEIILLIKKLLYEQRYTIAGARQKLREMGVGRALETGSAGRSRAATARATASIRDELIAIRAML